MKTSRLISSIEIRTFIIAVVITALYHGAWHIVRYAGLHWPNSLNIPGFFIMTLSYPWSAPVLDNLLKFSRAFPGLSKYVIPVLVCLGASLNLTIVVFVFRHLRKWQSKASSDKIIQVVPFAAYGSWDAATRRPCSPRYRLVSQYCSFEHRKKQFVVSFSARRVRW